MDDLIVTFSLSRNIHVEKKECITSLHATCLYKNKEMTNKNKQMVCQSITRIEKRNLTHAVIVTSVLVGHQFVRYTNDFTQEKNLISASIVISALPCHQLAGNTNEFTQVKNLISACIVINALLNNHTVRHMSEFTQE